MNENARIRLGNFVRFTITNEHAAIHAQNTDQMDDFVQRQEVIDIADQYLESIKGKWIGKTGIQKYDFKELTGSPVQTVVSQPPQPVAAHHAAAAAVAPIPPATPAPTTTPVPPNYSASPSSQPSGSAPVHPAVRPGHTPPFGATAPKLQPKAVFRIPNAKAGEAYAGKVEGKDAAGISVRIVGVEVPPDLGIKYDLAAGELVGTPETGGEYCVTVSWSAPEGAQVLRQVCELVVIHDARKLWELSIEPPADGQYFKCNTDSRLLVTPTFKIAAASRRGRSHARAGTFRDDDFHVANIERTNWSILIVADGAGSAKYSREGSRLASFEAGAHLRAALEGDVGARMNDVVMRWASGATEDEKVEVQHMFHRLYHEAGVAAVEAIKSAATATGNAVKDYSTTLLAALVHRYGADTFVATFWMGDGAISAYGPLGKMRLMGAPDSGEFAGQTRFLDQTALFDPSFGKRISIGHFSGLLGILLMTDGVSDPRFETDNGLSDPARWDALWADLLPHLTECPDESLLEWLNFFTPGHHDDRTIAILW